MLSPPPVINNKSFQSQNNFSGISLSRAGLSAETAMQASPELGGIFQNTLFGAELKVSNHPTGKMFVN
jgi:hypothetical protein